ncbi:MAG: hypothetical protein ACTHJW_00350 [Streptosporangiaceae bacterium]
MFSVDPGLLPIGLSKAALTSAANVQSSEARIFDWIRDQFAAGRGADAEDAARLVLALASGTADRLSGRHISVPTASMPCSPGSTRSSATTFTRCDCEGCREG